MPSILYTQVLTSYLLQPALHQLLALLTVLSSPSFLLIFVVPLSLTVSFLSLSLFTHSSNIKLTTQSLLICYPSLKLQTNWILSSLSFLSLTCLVVSLLRGLQWSRGVSIAWTRFPIPVAALSRNRSSIGIVLNLIFCSVMELSMRRIQIGLFLSHPDTIALNRWSLKRRPKNDEADVSSSQLGNRTLILARQFEIFWCSSAEIT